MTVEMKLILAIITSFTIVLSTAAADESSDGAFEGASPKGAPSLPQRALKRSSSECGKCEFPTYYHYRAASPSDAYVHGVFAQGVPRGCVLAAIRDERSRRGAQYAIPEGKIAITQGYFPIENYIHQCSFEAEKTLEGLVFGCSNPYGSKDYGCCRDNNFYTAYFKNYEGTHVPDDCWVDLQFPIPDGAIWAGIAADGLLRPVISWQDGENEFGWDGAVYECCPQISDICAQVPPDDSSN